MATLGFSITSGDPILTIRAAEVVLEGAAVKRTGVSVADCVATTGAVLGMAQGWHRGVSTTALRTWQRWHQLGGWVRPVQVRAALQGYVALKSRVSWRPAHGHRPRPAYLSNT